MLPLSLSTELKNHDLKLLVAEETENFLELSDTVSLLSWPEFMLHDAISNQYWSALHDKYAAFQFALIDINSQKWIAVGNSIPVYWPNSFTILPDAGWDWALSTGMQKKSAPNFLCALAIQVLPKYRGKGLSVLLIKIMKEIGHANGLDQLIAPVRPNRKCDYPLLSTSNYIEWLSGVERFDPWLRVHERMKAQIIRVCPKSMQITGKIKSWEKWTGLSFQESGKYIVPGALVPVEIDLRNDLGQYTEPNVWVIHRYT